MKKTVLVMMLALIGLTSCFNKTIHWNYHTIDCTQTLIVSSVRDDMDCDYYYVYLSSSSSCKDTIMCLTEAFTYVDFNKTPCSYKVGDIVELKKK